MNILLANPAVRESVDQNRERYFIKAGSRWPWSYIKKKKQRNTSCFFPFFLAYAASILIRDGHTVRVVDGVALDMPENIFIESVVSFAPDLLVIEVATHSIQKDIALCQQLKRCLPSSKVLLCGAHATVFAREILEENHCIDFVAKGEYELIVSELVKKIQEGCVDFSIKGLNFRDGEKICVSQGKGFIEDINMLPYPAFELFPANESPDLSRYRDGITTYWPAVTLHSSRGCPFQCDFCMWNQIMYGNGAYRKFEPKRIVNEMEYVISRFGAREIYFDDDDFCVDKNHVLQICSEIKARNLMIHWSCMGDAIVTDEEMIVAMANAGCIFMKFGVESGNREVLKRIGKPLKPEKAIEVARLCRKHGIMTHATFSFGLDGESKETMKETLRLANRMPFDTAQASITTPFPGTRYYEKLKARGSLKETSWDSFDGTTCCTFESESLSSQDIENFRKKAIRSMVLHKILDLFWIYNFLKRNYQLVKNYGWKTVLEPVAAFLHL